MMRRWTLLTVAALVVLCAAPSTASARRRLRMPPQFVATWIGYGLSSSNKGDGPDGQGFYLEGEYILLLSDWFSPRAYAGTLITFSDSDFYCREAGIHCDVSAKIGFLGVKGRVTIPIPYVAPFFELGLGASIGVMTTRTLTVDERMAGATYHVPFTLGLSLGEHHNWDLAFSYLLHPSEKRRDGAIAAGFSFQVGGRPPN